MNHKSRIQEFFFLFFSRITSEIVFILFMDSRTKNVEYSCLHERCWDGIRRYKINSPKWLKKWHLSTLPVATTAPFLATTTRTLENRLRHLCQVWPQYTHTTHICSRDELLCIWRWTRRDTFSERQVAIAHSIIPSPAWSVDEENI